MPNGAIPSVRTGRPAANPPLFDGSPSRRHVLAAADRARRRIITPEPADYQHKEHGAGWTGPAFRRRAPMHSADTGMGYARSASPQAKRRRQMRRHATRSAHGTLGSRASYLELVEGHCPSRPRKGQRVHAPLQTLSYPLHLPLYPSHKGSQPVLQAIIEPSLAFFARYLPLPVLPRYPSLRRDPNPSSRPSSNPPSHFSPGTSRFLSFHAPAGL